MKDVLLAAAVMWSILLRLLTSTFPYSGMAKPPMYGDFEAQRHWMEITTQLPLKEWYVNSTKNDLMYWGLDYPPLTAYHSWACGKVSELFDPSWTALNSSRGHESDTHKLFMRWTVLISDLAVFYPAVLYFGSLYRTNIRMATAVWAILINPALILIDHGHFQYNCVCLGLFVLTVALAKKGHYALAAIAFSLSLNFKQIALYFAVPVFIHLLKACLVPSLNVKRFLLITIATVATFGVLWAPFAFVGGQNLLRQVLLRIFPFQRGLFEDKVANFWYVTSVLIKYKKLFKPDILAQMALGATLLFSLPSWVMLWAQGTNPHRRILNFKLALFNTSMAFFLFSYQVHEKSILFPLVALSLITNEYPEFVLYFTGVACFSLVPLLAKDGLTLAYVPLVIQMCILINETHLEGIADRRWNKFYLLRIMMFSSLGLACVLHLVEAFMTPPARYPQLFVLLNYAFSFGHFILFYLYGHVVQWRFTGEAAEGSYTLYGDKSKWN